MTRPHAERHGTVELIEHRDLFRENSPAQRCPRTNKLCLTNRQAHRAVRLMRRRGADTPIYHYRCPDCLARHTTSMPREYWPEAPLLNSPAIDWFSEEDFVA